MQVSKYYFFAQTSNGSVYQNYKAYQLSDKDQSKFLKAFIKDQQTYSNK